MNDTNDAQRQALGMATMTSLATGYWRSCVLFCANSLDLFSTIGSTSATADILSDRLGLDRRALQKLLDACVSLQLLHKAGHDYRLSETSRVYLDRTSPTFIGHWVSHWADMLAKGNWQKLTDAITSGDVIHSSSSPYSYGPQNSPLRNWVLGMHETGLCGQAALLSSAVPLNAARTLLDVGGGSGVYSICLCQAYPNLTATILDSPDVGAIARDLVAGAHLEDRIRIRDLEHGLSTLDEHFDVVLLSNVLHMFNVPRALTMLQDAVARMTSTGLLLVQEWLLDDDLTAPELPCLFNIHLQINPGGDVLSRHQLRDMLQKSGLVCDRIVQTDGLYDIVVARKNNG